MSDSIAFRGRSETLRPVLSLATWAALVLVAGSAVASPGSNLGFGTRSPALAGATVADSEGPVSVFENPAELVRAPGTWLSLGYGTSSFDFRVDGRDAGLESVGTIDFGAVVPGAVLELPVAFGLAFSLPNGRFSRLRTALPTDPHWPLDDARSELFDLGMALAARPLESLSLGVGVGFLAAVRGRFRVLGTAVAADGSGAEYDSSLVHAVDADLVSVRYPIAGARFEPSERLTFGLSYRGEARVEQRVEGLLLGDVRVGLTDIPVRYAFRTRATAAFSPRTGALGASVRVLDRLTLHGELEHQAWSSYPTPYAEASAQLTASPPPGVTLEPPPDRPAPPAPKLADRFVPRVGAEARLPVNGSIAVALRAGYAFERSPVPERQPQTLLFDFDRHRLGLGAEAVLKEPFDVLHSLRLEASFSLSEGAERSVVTGPDAAPVEHYADGRVVAASVALGFVFAGSGGH